MNAAAADDDDDDDNDESKSSSFIKLVDLLLNNNISLLNELDVCNLFDLIKSNFVIFVDELEDLIPNAGTLLFVIKKDDEFVRSRKNLNIFNPGDTPDKRPLDITLFVRQNDSP